MEDVLNLNYQKHILLHIQDALISILKPISINPQVSNYTYVN